MKADDTALEGGRWVLRGNIQVWVPEDPFAWGLVRTERKLADLIACPSCHAKVTEPCRTSSGHTTTPHSCRLTGRLCECGATLTSQRRMCDPCRDDSLRVSKRDYLRRRRAAVRQEAA